MLRPSPEEDVIPRPRQPVRKPPYAQWSLAAALLLILGATLTPATMGPVSPHFTCMLCDEHGTADAILNVVLFIPLGVTLALNRGRGLLRLPPVVYGALLSTAIELAQNLIPGRDPSLRDILTNTVGAGAGAWLLRASPWLRPNVGTAARLGLAWSAGVTLLFALTAWLLAPAFPTAPYVARWTPSEGAYRGRVLMAELGTVPLPPRRLDSSAQVRAMLLAGDPLEIMAIAGPANPEFRSLFRIRDDRRREILQVGPDRDDLVVRYRTHAAAWRLDQPDLRLRGAFAGVAVGDTLQIRAWRQRGGVCLHMNAERVCPAGFTLGSGWALLWYPDHLPGWLQGLFGLVWIAGLSAPLGVWFTRTRLAPPAIGLMLVGLFVLPPATGLLATSPGEVLAAALGWGLGAMLRVSLGKSRR